MNKVYQICINHLLKHDIHVPLEGHGDCTKCRPDNYNSNCSGYVPTTVRIIGAYGEINEDLRALREKWGEE